MNFSAQRRVGRAEVAGRSYWVTAEKASALAEIFPRHASPIRWHRLRAPLSSRDEALRALVNGWLEHAGRSMPVHFHGSWAFPWSRWKARCCDLNRRAPFCADDFPNMPAEETEWCARRLLARIHRMTLGKLRREIEPVSAAKFMDWLLHWQHVAPGTQLIGEYGTLEVLRQLQGYEAPANAWERQILASRVSAYDPEVLDRLCLTGALGWGRFSPHPAMLREPPKAGHA